MLHCTMARGRATPGFGPAWSLHCSMAPGTRTRDQGPGTAAPGQPGPGPGPAGPAARAPGQPGRAPGQPGTAARAPGRAPCQPGQGQLRLVDLACLHVDTNTARLFACRYKHGQRARYSWPLHLVNRPRTRARFTGQLRQLAGASRARRKKTGQGPVRSDSWPG